MKLITVSFIIFSFLSSFTNSDMASAQKAKRLAKASINKQYSKAKDVVIELNEWDYDNYRGRYRIKFDASYKQTNFLGITENIKQKNMYLKCDEDGGNAAFGQTGFWDGFEVKWSSVYD